MAEVRPCLDSLAAQGVIQRTILVLSGVGASATRDYTLELERQAQPVTVLAEPSGLSRARNRALAECRDDEVLAFIDDDAIAAPNWYASYAAEWARAPARVACIGGPIRPRFQSRRPAWLSDGLLTSLSVLDFGPARLEVDPANRSLYGANLTFRCGPLRAVGGFDVALGRGARRRAGEDDRAQRLLFGAGYAIWYAPDPWVWHVIPDERMNPTEILRRRFDYGMLLGMDGGRELRLALRRIASGTTHLLVDGLRGDASGAMDAAVKLTENMAVLVGRTQRRRAA